MSLHFAQTLVLWYDWLKIQLFCFLAEFIVIQLGFVCSVVAELPRFNHLAQQKLHLLLRTTYLHTDITRYCSLIEDRIHNLAYFSKLRRRRLGILVNSFLAWEHFENMLKLNLEHYIFFSNKIHFCCFFFNSYYAHAFKNCRIMHRLPPFLMYPVQFSA